MTTRQMIINLIALSSRVDSPTLSLAAERLRDIEHENTELRHRLEAAEAACDSYWEWEWGTKEGAPEPKLLAKWREIKDTATQS